LKIALMVSASTAGRLYGLTVRMGDEIPLKAEAHELMDGLLVSQKSNCDPSTPVAFRVTV
jgi:hypothetical protein